MILDQIILKNFGVYGGRHEIDLTPPSSETPIVLIGALNGGGKTTLLDALQTTFYGAQASCSGRGRLSYKDYLRAMVHRGADITEGASLQVKFRRITEGRSRELVVTRSWRDAGKGLEEFVEVACDGVHDAVLSEHWQEYIESYLPVRLAGLFFFDGEQITNMAEDDHAAGLLGTAIHSLLGLDLVERLQADLDVLERRKKGSAATEEGRKRLDEMEAEVAKAESAQTSAHAEMTGLNTTLARLAKELKDLRAKFKNEGGELFARRAELEGEREKSETELLRLEHELRELAAEATPLLLVENLLGQVAKQVDFEVGAQHAKVVAVAEEARDRNVIAALKRKNLDSVTLAAVEAVLIEHRPERDIDESRLFLHPGEDFPEELRRLCEVTLPQADEKMTRLLEQSQQVRERKARLDEQLNAVPDAEAIGKLHREIIAMEERIRQTEAAHKIAEEKHRQLAAAFELKGRQLRNAMGELVDDQQAAADDLRILQRIPKVRGTLESFRQKVIARHVAKIERLIHESFQHLLRKTQLVSGLHIDPATFRITMTGGDGKPLGFERLSAGERQLLATAILWGLAKASGRPVPTVIDTPLGRLDSSHRTHLVERYFPAASHQVILLSTDEEITDRYLDMLKPFVGRSYSLMHDDMKRSTVVLKGYFAEHETTR